MMLQVIKNEQICHRKIREDVSVPIFDPTKLKKLQIFNSLHTKRYFKVNGKVR